MAPLAAALLGELARRTGKTARRLTPEALARLEAHDWPGNVRELANVLERALILAPGEELGSEVIDLPGRRRREGRLRAGELPTLADATRQHIARVLQATRGPDLRAGRRRGDPRAQAIDAAEQDEEAPHRAAPESTALRGASRPGTVETRSAGTASRPVFLQRIGARSVGGTVQHRA